MFHWLKRRLVGWVENRQRGEIARLQQEAMRLKQELERTTGELVRLTPEERSLLAQKSRGIDPDTLKQISVLDTDALIDGTESTENR
ncbi:MAG: hypothetical protein DWQ34_09435 [Planctomycetota bacterium]|nr:MAG: hypothetical protein DWQ34_09435 [Planctomycetota bacterium]REK28341.1 MAG: hypothetical protein DWQ41_06085 [Planctomycetota bacterium]REK38817.1 MAG: hypothetical protein DWQ45_02930 [Planctomycetota bacterium]